MKDMHDLEYVESTSSTQKKLSEDEWFEVCALLPFMNAMQNETGPIKSCPIDISQFSRDDFMRYLEDSYDPDNPTKYDLALAQAFAHVSEKHNKEMKELSSRLAAATANTMTSGADVP